MRLSPHIDHGRAAELAVLARRIVSATNAIEASPGVRTAHVVARNDPAHLAALATLVDRGVLTIDVSEHHTLDDLATLHRRSEAGDLRGKVIVRPA
jgi:NADPH:quinone reductase-like Zn-dependent oxidoreductase